jgi:hypothetical protein
VPTALANGLVPDPDPNASQNDPQPDAYQSVPAMPAPSSPAPEQATPPLATPPLLPTVTVPVSHPPTTDRSRSALSQVRPSVVPTPVQAAVAANEAPAVRSTPSRTESHIAIPTAVHTVSVTRKQRSHAARSAAHRQRHVVHRTHKDTEQTEQTPIWFARAALDLRWPAAFAPSAAVMEAARPRHVPPRVALAVAAVVLLSGSFLIAAARHVREQVTP